MSGDFFLMILGGSTLLMVGMCIGAYIGAECADRRSFNHSVQLIDRYLSPQPHEAAAAHEPHRPAAITAAKSRPRPAKPKAMRLLERAA